MRRSEILRLLKGLAILGVAQVIASPGKAIAIGGILPDLDVQAPDFDLEAAAQEGALGQRLQRDTFRGSWLVLYFYPRDFTSGCTL